MTPIVKICGLTSQADAARCAGAGADWLGFIFHEPSPRGVTPELAAGFPSGPARRVGVFVNQSPDEVLAVMETAALDLAQLHGGQSAEFGRAVGPERVIRVVWPGRFDSPDDLRRELDSLADSAAYFLFDAGTGGGGHGRALDLGRLGDLRPPRPWLLAGGLTAELAAGVLAGPIRPAGFDFNSGVESAPGRKDPRLVEAAIRAVRGIKE